MFKTRRNITLALTAYALLLPPTLNATPPVERPFKLCGNITLVLDLPSMTWAMKDWGEATHMGRYANHGSGSVADPSLANGEGSGVNTVASNDQVCWELAAHDGVWTVTFTGGTGRFVGVSGSFIAVPGEIVVAAGPGPAQITYTFSYTGSGTIMY